MKPVTNSRRFRNSLQPSSCSQSRRTLLYAIAALVLTIVSISSILVRNSMLHAPQHANIAFLIQVVPSTLPHLPRLYRRLHHPDNVYGLHFDVKIPQADVNRTVKLLRSQVHTFDRNTLLVPPDVIVYNGVSMILNTLAAITFLLKESKRWHFFINLSGSDYPLTDAYLPRELLGHALRYDPQFFSLAPQDHWQSRFKIRYEHMFVDPSVAHKTDDLPNLIVTDLRNPLFDHISFTPVHSEAWMILSRSFCDFAAQSPTARRMLLAVANMRGSDEFFFASLAYNTPRFNRSIVSKCFRKVIWTHDGVHSGQHPYVIDQFEDGNYTFLEELRDASQWHARKFVKPESKMMDHIDKFANDPVRVSKVRYDFRNAILRLRHQLDTTPDTPDTPYSPYSPDSPSTPGLMGGQDASGAAKAANVKKS